MKQKTILNMLGITKVYSNGVVANKGVNFSAYEGEIHALMGENGAGKSTLMKILFGQETLDEGEIFLDNKPIAINSSLVAIEHKIGMVFQHFMLVENLTVMENIMLGMEPKKGIFFDKGKGIKKVEDISEKYNFNINPNEYISNMNVSQKQKVEILKVLIRGAKILILDEPTAVLTPQETDELFEQLLMLKNEGHTIIFISHKLKEIKAICERITIMRNGRSIGTYLLDGMSIDDISRFMVGRDIVTKVEKTKAYPKEVALEAEDVVVVNEEGKVVVNHVSIKVRSGEIVGIAAIEGNGQREFIDYITGLGGGISGIIKINNKQCSGKNPPLLRREKGMVHIPEDRLTYGIAKTMSIKDNFISNRFFHSEYQRGIALDLKKIDKLADELVEDYLVKTDSTNTPVSMLSGGNMQKVVVAREMSTKGIRVIIADQPTRGIDIGAATFIRDKLIKLRDNGIGILLSSADMNEVIELSDKLIVFYEGSITGAFNDLENFDEKILGLYMLGLKQMKKEDIEKVISGE
ncbi:MAG: ABC transporter ATP-binding protein [Lachnospirales bacterium]